MATLQNVFSWSKSRDEQFRECPRQYYFDKYLSWGGWDKYSPKDSRLAYILKNLKNRWAWKGETVHHVIEDCLKALRAGQPISLEAALERLTLQMRQDYRNSKAKKYMQEPKKTVGLFEHEYERPVSDEVWKEIHDSSAACLKNFYGSDLYRNLLNDDKSNWLVIEDLEEFNFEGSKIYVKLDFARKNGNTVEIYDWKTGKEEEGAADLQMGTYSLYAMGKWGVKLSDIRGLLVFLGTPNPQPKAQKIDEALIEKTKVFMRQSISSMQALLEDKDRNIPLPRDRFAFTENTRMCRTCNFYKICEKYKTTPPSAAADTSPW